MLAVIRQGSKEYSYGSSNWSNGHIYIHHKLLDSEEMIYHRLDVVPVGLRPSDKAIKIVMNFWIRGIREIEKQGQLLAKLNPVLPKL